MQPVLKMGRGHEQPLEPGGGEERILPEPPEGTSPADTLTLAL